jgi:hypothetical protein
VQRCSRLQTLPRQASWRPRISWRPARRHWPSSARLVSSMLVNEHFRQRGRYCNGAADWSALQASFSADASACLEAVARVGRSCSRPASTRGMMSSPVQASPASTQQTHSDLHPRYLVLKLTSRRVQDGERLERLLARAQQAAEDAHCDAARANAAAADARAQLAARPVDSHQARLPCGASGRPLGTILCLHMFVRRHEQAQRVMTFSSGHVGDISPGSAQSGRSVGGATAGGARQGACAAQAGAQARVLHGVT